MQNIYKSDPEKIIVGMVGRNSLEEISSRTWQVIHKQKNLPIFKLVGLEHTGIQYRSLSSQISYRYEFFEKLDNNLELKNDFFANDESSVKLRNKIAFICLDELIEYINIPENKVAILDGTNTTRERRAALSEHLKKNMKEKYQLIWIESICNDEKIIAENIKKVKVHGLDFKGKSEEEASKDFSVRITKYQEIYETLTKEEEFPYIKTINVGAGVEVNKINGYLPEKIMTYTINLTISPNRNIYLSRHGESQFNIEDRLGGDPELSELGMKYAKILPKVLDELIKSPEERENLTIITSTLKRTIQTAQYVKINKKPKIELRVLDEINAGICETMTYKEMKSKYPELYEERELKKLQFRYPSGESYLDVIGRLEPLIYWIERQKNSVFVIGHQAIIRCISAYFFNINLEDLPFIPVPLHKLIRLIPETYTFQEEYVNVDLENEKILSIVKPMRKKMSIDPDGSNKKEFLKPKRGFKSVKSDTSVTRE